MEANDAAAMAYGYTTEELLKMTIYDLRAADSSEIVTEQIAKAFSEGLLFETRHRRKDGSIFPVDVSARGAVIGDINMLISVIRDITKRKKIEEALQENEELFRVTFDKSPIAAAMINLDQKIVRANDELYHLLGYAEGELIGMTLRDITHPDDIEKDLQHLQRMLTGAISHFTMEKRYLTKDGNIIWGQLAASAIRDSTGRIKYFVGMIEDVTERRQTVFALQEQTERLKNANNELESFSYSVSHDLKAPLRAIDGYARMILKKKGDSFDEETRRLFNVIQDNAQRMNLLIDEILALSRLDRQTITVSRIEMDVLVNQIWESIRMTNPDMQATLRIDNLPAGMGDRTLIGQALTNLLSNAVKYSGMKAAPVVEVGCHANERENIYYVKDNGVGFDMQYCEKLFGVFQRLHSVDQFEGTGIGLAIVQRIIHRHKGRVWAEGEVDKGASFYFTLPRKENSLI